MASVIDFTLGGVAVTKIMLRGDAVANDLLEFLHLRKTAFRLSIPDQSVVNRHGEASDLLYAEHIANEVLREVGFATAQTRTFHIGERVFLESTRFDRIGSTGRRGLVSLRALDAAHLGLGQGNWAKAALKLHSEKWITAEDCARTIRLHCFGELIANTDMHWGNLSFFLPEQSPYPLAPVYDMLPMRFRPSSTGEVIERTFEPTLPKPEDQAAWLEIVPHALTFWQRITEHEAVSADFQQIATQAIDALQRIHKIATN